MAESALHRRYTVLVVVTLMLASPRVHGQTEAGLNTQQNGAVITALPLSRTSGTFGDAAACGPEDPAITNPPKANKETQIAPLARASAADAGGYQDPWSQVKGIRAGPLSFDFSGQVRMRYERDVGFTLLGYEPGAADDLLLERVRLDLSARLWNRPRLFLQLQDSHAFLTTLVDSDFPSSSPIEDTLDIRQLYAEWLRIGGSAVGFRIGRQEISYGDQRVFGPGSWGNTGRFSWDAAMLKVDTHWFGSDLWIGKFLQYKSDVWPDRAVDEPLTLVSYTQVKRLPFRLDLFYVMKDDSSTDDRGRVRHWQPAIQHHRLPGRAHGFGRRRCGRDGHRPVRTIRARSDSRVRLKRQGRCHGTR